MVGVITICFCLLQAKELSSNQLVGPKPFPLDRLLAIFYSIVDERVTPTANIFSQVSSFLFQSMHFINQLR